MKRVKLVFHYNFYIKAMPDDPKVVAIFYGLQSPGI
jgi:hypothetical protein